MLQAIGPGVPRIGASRPHIPFRGAAVATPNRDTVLFTGRAEQLFKKYGINPDAIPVVPADAKLVVDKRTLIAKILEAHEQAKKNMLLGNYSSRYFSSNILLNNGTWGMGTNIEMSRDRVFCGERSAMVNAWNRALEKLPLGKLANGDKEALQAGMTAKLLTFSQGTSPECDWAACAECLSWMGTQRYFTPDTQLAHLYRQPDTGQLVLRIGSVQGHLPYTGKKQVSKSDQSIGALMKRVHMTPRAENVVLAKGIRPETLQALLEAAKTAYEQNQTAELSGKRLGSAVLLEPDGRIVSGQRFDWTQRWNTPPDLLAGIQGFQQAGQAKEPAIAAVAYYGDDPDIPAEPSLGPISQGRGGADTLFVVLENDQVHVRTLRDYMPFVYISSKTNRKV